MYHDPFLDHNPWVWVIEIMRATQREIQGCHIILWSKSLKNTLLYIWQSQITQGRVSEKCFSIFLCTAIHFWITVPEFGFTKIISQEPLAFFYSEGFIDKFLNHSGQTLRATWNWHNFKCANWSKNYAAGRTINISGTRGTQTSPDTIVENHCALDSLDIQWF